MFFEYLISSHVVLVTVWSASKSGLDELVARGVSSVTAVLCCAVL